MRDNGTPNGVPSRSVADNDEIAANVRAELARGKHQQQKIGQLLGVSRMAIHRRLTGETAFRIDELQKIAVFLDVPVSALIGEEKASA